MKVKYQIFVSSTYEDLRIERDVAIKAILEMGHIPVGMEMFSAADEEQWEIIKRQIDDSDYYVVIVAHRYGSLDRGISYTEKEYDYALSISLPALGFIINDSAEWSVQKIDSDAITKDKLLQFKDKVKKKPVGFWKTAEELHAKVSIALMKTFTTTPRQGWARSTLAVGPEVTNELSRLSKENAELRASYDQLTATLQLEKRQLEEEDLARRRLTDATAKISVKFAGEKKWTLGPNVTMYEIFEALAPSLVVETPLLRLSKILAAKFARRIKVGTTSNVWPISRNMLNAYLAVFKACGLTTPSTNTSPAKAEGEYWSLTAKGEKLHSAGILRGLDGGESPKPEPEEEADLEGEDQASESRG